MSFIFFEAKSLVNDKDITEQVEKKCNGMQAKLDAIILADSNYFCPLKTGTLQKSVITTSRLGSGKLTWSTPYAKRLYYNYQKPEYQANPNATRKWFEVAKARWLAKWARFINDNI